LPARVGRRRAIIVIVSALVAVVIGIVLLLVFGGKHNAGTAPGTAQNSSRQARAAPVEPKQTGRQPADDQLSGPTKAARKLPPILLRPRLRIVARTAGERPAPATAAPKSPAASAAHRLVPPRCGSDAVAGAARPDGDTCFADVSSVPAAPRS